MTPYEQDVVTALNQIAKFLKKIEARLGALEANVPAKADRGDEKTAPVDESDDDEEVA